MKIDGEYTKGMGTAYGSSSIDNTPVKVYATTTPLKKLVLFDTHRHSTMNQAIC
jgi:hypothetical protein